MTEFKCYYCNKPVDVINEFFFHSVTHNVYMHLPCFEEYEDKLTKGKIKSYFIGEKWYEKLLRWLRF